VMKWLGFIPASYPMRLIQRSSESFGLLTSLPRAGRRDLIVGTADVRHEFELPNFHFADAKIREAAEIMKTRPIPAH